MSHQAELPATTQQLLVVCGGCSLEHEISLASAVWVLQVAKQCQLSTTLMWIDKQNHWFLVANQNQFIDNPQQALAQPLLAVSPIFGDATKQWQALDQSAHGTFDVLFSVIHGTDGEDGPMQGLARFWQKPFIGPDVQDAVASMHKHITKTLLAASGIPVVPWMLVIKHHAILPIQLPSYLSFPLFVKVSNGGSSLGVYKVHNEQELQVAIETVWDLDTHCLIEQAVDGQEIEVAALLGTSSWVSEPGELEVFSDFYDYRAKYLDSEAAKPHVRARISAGVKQQIMDMALEVCQVLNNRSFVRIDFFVDDKDKVYVNEVNPIPGLTSISMFPMLCAQAGITAIEVMKFLIQQAVDAFEQAQQELPKKQAIAAKVINHG